MSNDDTWPTTFPGRTSVTLKKARDSTLPSTLPPLPLSLQPQEGCTSLIQGADSHHSWTAKQVEPNTNYNELGKFHHLIATRILAHCKFRRSFVSSSILTKRPQASPILLKKLIPKDAEEALKFLPTLLGSSYPLRGNQQKDFTSPREYILPLNHLTPECSTRSTSTSSSNSKSINGPPIKAKRRCPLNIQLDCAQDLGSQGKGAERNPPQLPTKLLLRTSLLLSITSFSVSNQTAFRNSEESEMTVLGSRSFFPTLVSLRLLPPEGVAKSSSSL